jgi:hypothetical protein
MPVPEQRTLPSVHWLVQSETHFPPEQTIPLLQVWGSDQPRQPDGSLVQTL